MDVSLLVRNQDTNVDRLLLTELRSAVTEAGWSHQTVISMTDSEAALNHHGLWTYKPWIFLGEKRLKTESRRSAGGQRWILFLEPATVLNVSNLESILAGYDARKPIFLGRALKDDGSEPPIIHHFSTEPPYPHAHCGFALSAGLVRKMMKDLKEARPRGGQQIEPVWEFASFIKSLGIGITDRSDVFCTERSSRCASWVRQRDRKAINGPLASHEVMIGVKTVDHYHAARIPIVHKTWGSTSLAEVVYLSNKEFSGVAGAKFVDLTAEFGDAVDPAKESDSNGNGHCTKMQSILRYFSRHKPGKRWYIVTDDDTLLNVPRILEVLASHNDSEALYVGERYGWSHDKDYEGTNYVTTGGGMALSGPALASLLECETCNCPHPSSPDDMTMGSWFKDMPGVKMVHEEGFHQTEPHNYHPDILQVADPAISFHRFAVRLPASAPEAEVFAARQKSWKRWSARYFKKRKRKWEEL